MVNLQLELPDGFLNEEVRGGYTVTRQMKEVWAIELDLLCKFDEVCKKLDLTYCVDSGTLLGAIREKGFIPWDDDIDVVMLRDDYEVLINKGQKYFDGQYFLQSTYSDINYYRCHAQLRNTNTTGILPHEGKRVQFNQGVFIDIFVLDGIPEDQEILIKTIKQQNWYKFIINCMVGSDSESIFKSAVKKTLGKLFRIIYHSPEKVYAASKEKIMRWPDSKYIDKLWWRRNINSIHYLRKEWFSKCILMPFEWLKFPVPINYDSILSEYYGADYMKPRQAPSRHESVIFNTDMSYLDYLMK